MNARKLTVELKHASNPDIRGGYWEGRPSEGRKVVRATSLAEASKLCGEYISRNGLGGGNWTGGDVRDAEQGGILVARISYNGRAWEPGAWPTSEIDLKSGQPIQPDASVKSAVGMCANLGGAS